MLSTDAYLDELLSRYQANFDIEKDYKLGDKIYPAYAWFYSLSEKYVLKKEAQLWAIKAFEHVFFIKCKYFSEENLDDIRKEIESRVEPELVRKNEKYPEKDHMCSYMTFVIMCDYTPDKQTLKAIKRFHFDKGYLFNFRGHSEARVVLAAMDTKTVISNYSGRDLQDMMKDIFIKMEKTA